MMVTGLLLACPRACACGSDYATGFVPRERARPLSVSCTQLCAEGTGPRTSGLRAAGTHHGDRACSGGFTQVTESGLYCHWTVFLCVPPSPSLFLEQ